MTAGVMNFELPVERVHRIVFVGAFGVGKTTAIRAVSDIPVLRSDALISDPGADGTHAPDKTTTTVAIDYGEIHIDTNERYALYGVPGQARFSHIWDMVLPRAFGVVLLANPELADDLALTTRWLQQISVHAPTATVLIGATRVTPEDDAALAPYRRLIAPWHPTQPVFAMDPREPDHVRWMLATLLALAGASNASRSAGAAA